MTGRSVLGHGSTGLRTTEVRRHRPAPVLCRRRDGRTCFVGGMFCGGHVFSPRVFLGGAWQPPCRRASLHLGSVRHSAVAIAAGAVAAAMGERPE